MKNKQKYWNILFYASMVFLVLFIFRDFISEKVLGNLPKEVKEVIDLAGPNGDELEKVLDRYRKNDKDSLKFRAASYLITNSKIHNYKLSYFENQQGEKIDFYPPKYVTRQRTGEVRDSLMTHTKYYSEIKKDLFELESDFLNDHIDTMFRIWESTPWHNVIADSLFLSYTLPYRVQNEPLSKWHTILNNRYSKLIDSLNNPTIFSAAVTINNRLAEDIKYNNCWMKGLGAQSVFEIYNSKSGMCDDLSAFGVCAMRACGIPATVDFTLWAKTKMGHSWGVIFDENGKAWSFGPGEQNPGEHIDIFSQAHYRKLSKVYRRTFEINKTGLWSQVDNIKSVPPFLRQLNTTDVTSEYVPVFDISIPVEESYDHKLAYICVYNFDRWKPIFWGEIDNGKVIFQDMGADLLYVVAVFDGMRVIPITEPFIFRSNSQIEFLNGQRLENKGIDIKNTSLGFKHLKKNDKCKLHQWDGIYWKFIEEVVMQKDSFISFSKANENRLYKIDSFERPFTVSGNNVEIW